jgi:hypothetical protein
MRKGSVIVSAAALMLGGLALAADQRILGKRITVGNPSGDEADRSVVCLARESSTDIPALAGSPTVGGATLHVSTSGGTASSQTFVLGPAGWSATQTGFRYTGPTTDDPVRSVRLRRSPSGAVLLKVVLRGTTGMTDLAVLPPNPGDAASLELELSGGDRYCVALGGAAGGNEASDTGAKWKVVNATAEPPCPTSTSTTTSTTLYPPCLGPPADPACGSCGGGVCRAHNDPDPPSFVCVEIVSCTLTECTDDSTCAAGEVCAGFCCPTCP